MHLETCVWKEILVDEFFDKAELLIQLKALKKTVVSMTMKG